MNFRATRNLALIALAAAMLFLSGGCAVVSGTSVTPATYLAERRGDALTTGRISDSAQEVLRIVGVEDCDDRPQACRQRLVKATGISEEQRQSTLSELWLQEALALDGGGVPSGADANRKLQAWIETARSAWCYLFLTGRSPAARALEDRQTQVRDYYNFAVQRTAALYFSNFIRGKGSQAPPDRIADWSFRIKVDVASLIGKSRQIDELVAASTVRFTGIRNTYRRDGLGAPLVVVLDGPSGAEKSDLPYFENRYPAATALLRFDGANLQEVLNTKSVELALIDPYQTSRLMLAGQDVPVAANFTVGYGLWLARSSFGVQAIRTLLGSSLGISRPEVHLMQPYDRDRQVIVMIHGLASSPEAWVNLANEILGDDALRRRYQIWQVYYPTSDPVPLNLHDIRSALELTFAHFDPGGLAKASHRAVVIGHSMGGLIARLLVSNADEQLLAAIPAEAREKVLADPLLGPHVEEYLRFKALPQADTAIFISTPHRGTPAVKSFLGESLARLVGLPRSISERFADINQAADHLLLPDEDRDRPLIPNSIQNLSDDDRFIRAAANLPMDPSVRYHSIIARRSQIGSLADATDGVVPYASAHLDGAASELVLVSTHSVQEDPRAVVEVRRILRER